MWHVTQSPVTIKMGTVTVIFVQAPSQAWPSDSDRTLRISGAVPLADPSGSAQTMHVREKAGRTMPTYVVSITHS